VCLPEAGRREIRETRRDNNFWKRSDPKAYLQTSKAPGRAFDVCGSRKQLGFHGKAEGIVRYIFLQRQIQALADAQYRGHYAVSNPIRAHDCPVRVMHFFQSYKVYFVSYHNALSFLSSFPKVGASDARHATRCCLRQGLIIPDSQLYTAKQLSRQLQPI